MIAKHGRRPVGIGRVDRAGRFAGAREAAHGRVDLRRREERPRGIRRAGLAVGKKQPLLIDADALAPIDPAAEGEPLDFLRGGGDLPGRGVRHGIPRRPTGDGGCFRDGGVS